MGAASMRVGLRTNFCFDAVHDNFFQHIVIIEKENYSSCPLLCDRCFMKERKKVFVADNIDLLQGERRELFGDADTNERYWF